MREFDGKFYMTKIWKKKFSFIHPSICSSISLCFLSVCRGSISGRWRCDHGYCVLTGNALPPMTNITHRHTHTDMGSHAGNKHLVDFITACNYDPVKSTTWQSITTHALVCAPGPRTHRHAHERLRYALLLYVLI